MKVFLLAAGYATRLLPLTRDRPKALLEIGGKPILTHILERVLRLRDLSEVVVISNARFAHQFHHWRDTAPSAAPISILDDGTDSVETRLGAIGDLAFALRRVPVGDECWAVVAGDNLFTFDLRPWQDALDAGGLAHLALRRIRSSPTSYNEVTLSPDGRVTAFREKPADHRTGIGCIALYFFRPEIAGMVHEYLDRADGSPDAPGHLIAWLVPRVPVYGTFFEGEWYDIGTPDTLAWAQRHFGSLPPSGAADARDGADPSHPSGR